MNKRILLLLLLAFIAISIVSCASDSDEDKDAVVDDSEIQHQQEEEEDLTPTNDVQDAHGLDEPHTPPPHGHAHGHQFPASSYVTPDRPTGRNQPPTQKRLHKEDKKKHTGGHHHNSPGRALFQERSLSSYFSFGSICFSLAVLFAAYMVYYVLSLYKYL